MKFTIMKKISLFCKFKVAIMLLTLIICQKSFATEYNISFTASGASNTIESVLVQNLTKGTTVIVPAGNVLNLTDIATSVENTSSNVDGIRIYSNPINDFAIFSFNAKQDGQTRITVYNIVGRKIVGINRNLLQGNNTFKLSLPKGIYIIKVEGNGYSYCTKANCHSVSTSSPKIAFSFNESLSSNKPQKSKSAFTLMLFSTGDQLCYKGYTVGYTSVVFDTPISSKNINFNFSTAMDFEGNVYHTVTLGLQVWLVENLISTKYRNGDAIPNITDNATWNSLSSGAWCDYDNLTENGSKYGHLYNWYSLEDIRNIAPKGWHVPSDVEWTNLTNFLGGESFAGGKLKEFGTKNWRTPNLNATNETQFSALPGGYRFDNGLFFNYGDYGYWWSNTQSDESFAWFRIMASASGNVYRNKLMKTVGFSVRCIRDEFPSQGSELPTLTTTVSTSITDSSAISGGNISYDGGVPVTSRGLCWSTSPNPTIDDFKSIDDYGSGVFIHSIKGLKDATTYYVRAYATNNVGTAYGNEISITTLVLNTLSDIDGNIYHYIKIGNQTWMVENLKTTKYRNGENINNIINNDNWANATFGAWCDYDNNAANGTTLGHLYNMYSVFDSRKISPFGWHIPTDADWTTLTNYLGGESISGGKLKESGVLNWLTPNTDATNETGFSALGAGYRNSGGVFGGKGYSVYYWTSTEFYSVGAWVRLINYNGGYIGRGNDGIGPCGFAIRCIKD